MRPDLFVIARAESEDSISKLKKAGANRVISPYRIGAVQIAQTALRPAVVDFVEIATSSDNLELSIEEIKIENASELKGKSLSDASLRQRFSVVVVGIQRAGGRMEFNPAPDTLMSAGDHLVVLGSPSSLKELERAAAR
jgi:voltage-gated potassium channel